MTENLECNDELKKFLQRYCTLGVRPGYAVMLRGGWGSGKTWFVSEFVKQLKQQGKKSLYVSLYGVSDLGDIADQFFQQIHPRLAHPSVQKAWGLTKGLLKGTLKIDLDGDGDDDGNLQIGLPDLGKWASTSGAVLIFDDLERADMPLSKILGYINQFVEHEGYRVIILANESKCIEQDGNFLSIKEKVIGRTFEVAPDVPGALTDFINDIHGDESAHVLSSRTSMILRIFERSKCGNLRKLRQAVLDFADFWSCLPVNDRQLNSHVDFVDRLVEDVFSLSIEYRGGTFSADNIRELGDRGASLARHLMARNGEVIPKTEAELAFERHGLSSYVQLALSPAAYASFFSKGLFSETRAIEALEGSQFLADKNTPPWQRLWYRFRLEDDEFERCVAAVYSEFNSGTYTDEGVLLHAGGILLDLARDGFLEVDQDGMLIKAKTVVEKLSKSGLIDVGGRQEVRDFFGGDAAFGYRYIGFDTDIFTKFIKFYRETKKARRIEKFPVWAKEWMGELRDSPEKWAERIGNGSPEAAWFNNMPIFSFVEPSEFCDAVLELHAPGLHIVCESLKSRYEYIINPYQWKIEELEFWQSVQGLLNQVFLSVPTCKQSDVMRRQVLLPAIEKIIAELTIARA